VNFVRNDLAVMKFCTQIEWSGRGPTIWNKLPQDLRSTVAREQFKRRLKGWL